MIIFIVFPDKYISSITDGMKIFVISVLPSLFPFLFFSKILTELNFGNTLGNVFRKPINSLYNTPPISAYIMVMSFLCGYPIGSKLIADSHAQGLITDNEAKTISTFTSTSSPLFIVGVVGVTMLNSKEYGYILLIAHYLATIINGLLFRSKDFGKQFVIPNINTDIDYLNKSMTNSIISVLIVGGYIAIFNYILAVATDSGLFDIFSKFFITFNIHPDVTTGFFSGLIEMTKGSLLLSKINLAPIKILPLVSFILTFGGLSITAQSLTFLSRCNIKASFYLFTKITQGIFSFIITLIFVCIFY